LPIGPTFNGLRFYPTKCGGSLTILSALIVVAYLAAQISNIVLSRYPSVISRFQNIPEEAWNITSDQMLLANAVFTSNATIFPGSMDQYLSTVFVTTSSVENNKANLTYYNATFCQNVLEQDDPRYEGLYNFNCPDVPDLDNFTI